MVSKKYKGITKEELIIEVERLRKRTYKLYYDVNTLVSLLLNQQKQNERQNEEIQKIIRYKTPRRSGL